MKGLPQELIQTLDDYEEMQALHCQEFSHFQDHAPDMNRMNFQRARAFENLKYQLMSHRRTIDSAGEGIDRSSIGARLRKIIDTEKMIADMALDYQKTVVRKKNLMQQGKTALKGYGAMCAG